MNIDIFSSIISILNFDYLLMLLLGVLAGIIIGALPGFSATMGVALLVPFTYSLSADSSFALLIGVYCSAIYAGSIPAILINTPGTPASVVTTIDGFKMAKKGQAGKALGISLYSSVFGGIFSAIILIFSSEFVAKAALKFAPQEYFSLGIFGLTMVFSMTEGSLLKALIMTVLGLALSVVGMDVMQGFPRFTFGIDNLLSGAPLLPIMIGLFAITEVLTNVEDSTNVVPIKQKIDNILNSYKYLFNHLWLAIKASIIGTFMGALPGIGSSIAAYIAYNEASRTSKKIITADESMEKGIVAPEVANNAVTGGAMIPMLALGIPGDSVTAIMIGALLIHGLRPGPQLFVEQKIFVNGIFISMVLANVLILIFGLIGVRIFAKIINIPRSILNVFVIFFSLVGAYALQNSMFDVNICLIFGIIGFFFRRQKFPMGPFILSIILGPLIEQNFLMALSFSRGKISTFFTRPISSIFLILSLIIIIISVYKEIMSGMSKKEKII